MPRPDGPQFQDDDDDIRRRTEAVDALTSQGFPLSNIHVNPHGQAAVHYQIGNWIAKYKGGQIDIAHASDPDRSLDMINVYDYAKGRHARVTPQDLHNHLDSWIRTSGSDYMENM